MRKFVLASQSPRRKQLLEWAEAEFDIIVGQTDESYPDNLSPEEVSIHIARNKALKVQASDIYRRYDNNTVILAADTLVVLGSEIIGKPADREEAIKILTSLSGRVHQVITGVVLLNGNKTKEFADTTKVSFHELSRDQIEFYIDKYNPYDKAGSYAIQEWIGVVGIKSVEGDFYNVMGLPVSRVLKALNEMESN
ncbi:MAG: septum formation protein Maf [Bacteroidetes bacterium]|nr:MAG: septum formation protein Maf [Bacteroidota bacterium]